MKCTLYCDALPAHSTFLCIEMLVKPPEICCLVFLWPGTAHEFFRHSIVNYTYCALYLIFTVCLFVSCSRYPCWYRSFFCCFYWNVWIWALGHYNMGFIEACVWYNAFKHLTLLIKVRMNWNCFVCHLILFNCSEMLWIMEDPVEFTRPKGLSE